MRTTTNKALGAIALAIITLAAPNVFAYYNPATGCFLSRDPIGEPGFQLAKAAQAAPRVGTFALQQSVRWIDRNLVSEANTEDSLHPLVFGRHNTHHFSTLDVGGEDVDAMISAQNYTAFIVGGAPYLTAENDLINKTDLYGLVCNVVANRTKAIISSGINAGHEWLVYDGNSVGFWPNRGYVVLRPDLSALLRVPVHWQWDTVQKKSGKIKWGPAAGKSCACATCDDILSSINAAPNPGWHSFPIRNNCRRFVKWVLDGSCLKKGTKTSFNP